MQAKFIIYENDLMNIPMLSIADSISQNALRRPNHPAFINRDGSIVTYKKFVTLMNKTANHLKSIGILEGEILGLSMKDNVEHVVLMLGLIRMGAVVLPMDVRWTHHEKLSVANFFGAKSIISDEKIENYNTIKIDEEWHNLVSKQNFSGIFPTDLERNLWLSLSSGTTGIPKGPMLTHKQMIMRFIEQCISIGFNEHEINVLATPLYFGGGRNFTVSMLYFGGTVLLYPPPYDVEDLALAVNKYNATSLFLVPTLLRRLLSNKKNNELVFPKLRMLISSGSILHKEERIQIQKKLCPSFLNLYASTEAGAVSLLSPYDPPEKSGSVGQAAFMNTFEVVDESNKPVPVGEVGKIRQKAPWIPSGFYNNEEESKKMFVDDWYFTGDLGKVDEDGYLYIVGRVKDMIIRGGVNIYPSEIEDILNKHHSVIDTSVVAWPSEELGEEVAAFVVKNNAIKEEELTLYLKGYLAPYKIPKQIFFIDDLPKSAQGKVLKSELTKILPKI
ncbi:MAG: Long-chain-fatty-acid--CoA ligase [Alphaproteobacteria bacterium MarineAlpha2_Bin1]|nr:MAG: Long-chain-fatty-acid--CoA ligase [Alphaproteobacteria bacterium MarineAlpha2_Bin1]